MSVPRGWPAAAGCGLAGRRRVPSGRDVFAQPVRRHRRPRRAALSMPTCVSSGAFADRHAVLDVAESMRWRERPLLRLRSAPCGGSHRVAPRGWGRDAVTVAQSRQVGSEISAELCGEFRGLLSDEAIRGCVREAMTDLRGSIGREALPEMAVRLARARLTAQAQSRVTRGSAARLRLQRRTDIHQSGPHRLSAGCSCVLARRRTRARSRSWRGRLGP
jgi:hypothetical protein